MESEKLIQLLIEARTRTLALVEDLTDEQLIGPRLAIINPLLWEIGHIAWFQEKWLLRHLSRRNPIYPNSDSLYDSATVAHETRWDIPLFSRSEALAYLQNVLDCAIGQLQRSGEDLTRQAAYFYYLALFHENMHAEAITYTRQTCAYPPPKIASVKSAVDARSFVPVSGDREIAGGSFWLGASSSERFIFDNEKWAHQIEVAPFQIASLPVTNTEFIAFVEDNGYTDEQYWSRDGWHWRQQHDAKHPVYWQKSQHQWFYRLFDQIQLIPDDHPVTHINWYEAEAYCRWADRRLPTEAEWELAASINPTDQNHKRRFPWGDEPPTAERANLAGQFLGCVDVNGHAAGDSGAGCRQMIGNIWEWTATTFLPYPGFKSDPYKEYSQPWFGTHKVLRGGSWATEPQLIRNTYRNFFTPDRRDIIAGFRTCANILNLGDR